MADLSPISSWTQDDVLHFARRAGFGLSPEAAAGLAAQAPGAAIDAWIDGTGADFSLFNAVWADRADVVTESARNANTGGSSMPPILGPHRFTVQGADAWRNNFTAGQASWLWRMQYSPYPFQERMALFWHTLFATGWHKVSNTALMLQQIQLFRDHGLDRFDDLMVAVSKDPAMCIWLDSVENDAAWDSLPNENYAREVMELYSLGVNNGYTQTDVTQLARALSGWSFVVASGDWSADPTNPGGGLPSKGTFTVYQGQAVPAGTRYWWGGDVAADGGKLYTMHPNDSSQGTIAITYLGQGFDITSTANGYAPGEAALRAIVSQRGSQCSLFLAKRLLTHFATADFSAQDQSDLAAQIVALGFDMRAILKLLLKSAYFFDPARRFALVEGPVSWAARLSRLLCPALAAADAPSGGLPTNAGKGFPAWSVVLGDAWDAFILDLMGMKLLDPNGPNGWREHKGWLNSNTVRYRGRFAAAATLGETYDWYYYAGGSSYPKQTLTLFPTRVADWFPSAPATAADALARLELLLQSAPLPTALTDGWLTSLFGGGATAIDLGNATTLVKLRELAYLLLCSPAGQLY